MGIEQVGDRITDLILHIEVNVDEVEVLGDHDPVKRVCDILPARAHGITDAGAVGGDVHHVHLLEIGNLEIKTGGVGAQNLPEHGDDGVLLLADIIIGTHHRAQQHQHQHGDHDTLQDLLHIHIRPGLARRSTAASGRCAACILELSFPEFTALKAFEIRHIQPSSGFVSRILSYCEKKDKNNRMQCRKQGRHSGSRQNCGLSPVHCLRR